MSAIPDDVLDIAAEIVRRIEKEHMWRGDCVADVAQAIQAERQRCWTLTNQYAADHGLKHEHDSNGAVVDQTCADICKAIRMGDERKGE